MVGVVPVNIRTLECPGFFMIKCVGKIRILLLKVQQYPDFSILQTKFIPMLPLWRSELARNLKIWIFPNFRHYPRILASHELHAPGLSGIFACLRISSSIEGIRILTGTILDMLKSLKNLPACSRLHSEIVRDF